MENKEAIQRLTALWALSESGLGGIMHALKIPFTGFVLGGFAIVVITLLAQMSEKPFHTILRATFWVIMVKAAASPHTPPMAYIAVGFQGLIGASVFVLVPYLRLAAMLFGGIALFESAVQKFLVTTLLFGKNVWEALDAFAKAVLKELSVLTEFSFSFWLIAIYTSVYVCWGLLLGWWSSGLKNKLLASKDLVLETYLQTQAPLTENPKLKSNRGIKKLISIGFILLFIVTVFLFQGSGHKAFYVFIRSIAAIILLFYIITPLVQWAMKKWLQQNNKATEFTSIINVLPALRTDVNIAYVIAKKQHKGLARTKSFIENLLILALFSNKT